MPIVISNSSPLIILFKCNYLHLLQQFFGQVLIPEAVEKEVIQDSKDPEQRDAILGCDYIRVHPIEKNDFSYYHKIDAGEQEALSLAASLQANFLLLDDKRAQKVAKKNGITFIATLALLLKAVQKGIIRNIEDVLLVLRQKSIFINRELTGEIHHFLDRGI